MISEPANITIVSWVHAAIEIDAHNLTVKFAQWHADHEIV